jgi:hypothetical protein
MNKKKLLPLLILIFTSLFINAQSDTNKVFRQTDTVRVGRIVIIKNESNTEEAHNKIIISKRYPRKIIISKRNVSPTKAFSKVSTNWLILDFGFSNYFDKTDYGNTGDFLYNRTGTPPLGKSDFNLNTGKSLNVNIWFFMQRINLIKKYVNLKYGFGIEYDNYRFKSSSNLSYLEKNPYLNNLQSPYPIVIRDSISFSKNKLALNYLTVPLMVNFITNPTNAKKGLSISMGLSMGYLYGIRNKQQSDERGKEKNRGDYDLERFKLSYIAEMGLGPIRLYGSYSPNSIFSEGLIMKPYTIGIRLSNW